MSAKVSLNVESSPDALDRIANALETLSDQEDWPPDLLFTVNLVLEELGLNIINHAYHKESGVFEIVITSEDKALTIEVIDDGPPFNVLTEAPVPDVDAPIDDRPIGGLGVHLVKTMMDELDYRREQDQNHLTMVKRRDK